VNDRANHIAFTRLADLVEGRIGSDDQIEIREHVVACPVCAAELAWLERVVGLMRAATDEQPSAQAVAAAKRLLLSPAQPAARPQLVATLQFDSARSPIALGRRAGAHTERQLLFAVSSYVLDLRIVPHGDLWVVSGQLLGTDAGRLAELDGSAGTTRAAPNDMSEFALPPSPPGTYTLRVQLTDLDIMIAGLEVGA
jgi:anti-sigma factor RsiW